MANDPITLTKNKGMQSQTYTLAAGVPQAFDFDGDYLHCSLAPVADLTVRFDDGQKVNLRQGVGFRRYYSRVEFESATGQTFEVFVGFGSVADARSTANVNVTTSLQPGNTINDGGKVSCIHAAATQLLAADPTRLYALIKNISSNTLTMYIGSAGVTAAKGVPVEPGETLPYATTAAIYAYNADAAVDQYLWAASIQEV